jgi:hypothetical protein
MLLLRLLLVWWPRGRCCWLLRIDRWGQGVGVRLAVQLWGLVPLLLRLLLAWDWLNRGVLGACSWTCGRVKDGNDWNQMLN